MHIGKFLVISPLGNGNFGSVFRVLDPLLDVEKAVKVILLDESYTADEFVNSFNEAKILEKCKHPNIVEIKEVDVYNFRGRDLPCITTEYLKNGSVQALLENRFISVQQACKIITDVLYGLEHAHNQNIFHRDIKPGNILLSDNWKAKLSDFGLAYGLSGQAFHFAGYNPHLPPEVLENKVQDQLSDIYSLGITFFRVINNSISLPRPEVDMPTFIKLVKKEKFPDRIYGNYVPDSVIKIINKAIKSDRSKRFSTCLAFRQAIQRIKFGIDWKVINKNAWEGQFKDANYTLEIFKSKKGLYSIDFKRNGRRIAEKCSVNISTILIARKEFYRLIRETTVSI